VIAATARIHPTADLEAGVVIGDRTAVWAHVHAREGARVGDDCIVGEHTYLGPEASIGHLVKLNTRVYVPTGVTIGRGVMVGAHTVFTNDRYPRAADPDLLTLLPSEAGAATLLTTVGDGVSIGASCVIGPGIAIQRFAMVGMGSVVTHDVAAFHLVVGAPARPVGAVCRCGQPVLRTSPEARLAGPLDCRACGREYTIERGAVSER
jgi:UDP-2-acetamido-3-amino-2,3-dideoxy-glucuronate N-acetyltransferase